MNNERVADQTARDLNIDWIKIEEKKKRHVLTNLLDVIFSRKPKITLDFTMLEPYDMIIFMGPVWLGHPASPFRRIFDYLQTHQKKYGLITVCAGNNDCVSNTRLKSYLVERVGYEPEFVKELKIFDLLPTMDEKERNQKMLSYQVNQEDIIRFTEEAKSVIHDYM